MLAKFKQQGYPAWFAPALIIVMNMVIASGLALWPLLLTFQWDMTLPWTPSGLTRSLVTAIHVLTGTALLFFIGAVWLVHARAGWLRQERRISGTGILILMGLLLLSAPLILYVSFEPSLPWITTSHAVAGLLLPVFLLGHLINRRRGG
jgi:small-conductance mechanosensitive channel